MNVTLDATVLIDHLRGDPAAASYLRTLEGPPLCSEITRVEVHRGVRSHERGAMDALFNLIDWVALDEPIAHRAGELGRMWRASHPGIATADLIVAATAQERSTSLATANVKHFPMFEGLAAPYE